MSIEGTPRNNPESLPGQVPRQTSERLMRSMETVLKPVFSKIDVSGYEHLNELAPDENPIIATSHIENQDMPLAVVALGKKFDIVVTDQSVHHTFFGEPTTNLGLRVAGKENFIPIDWKKGSEGKSPQFNPDNFPAMKAAMDKGKSIVIAAHNPEFTGKLGKGGVGAIYLSQLTGQPILPFAVDMVKQGSLKRAIAKNHIGSPVRLEHIGGIEQLAQLDKKRRAKSMTASEKETYRNLLDELRKQSEIVMRAIAALLPEEKRGTYGG